eukprot:TRINITY_DN1148_c0_g1_i7.p1 TRINITY_DN1148_c0_g1~~TRINITY_DN1148_c0_g1_i7.p1  ORF type:complete len:662 (-),score=172.13 TRINITY_DN1148_c0_g1_i7:6-1739(-)
MDSVSATRDKDKEADRPKRVDKEVRARHSRSCIIQANNSDIKNNKVLSPDRGTPSSGTLFSTDPSLVDMMAKSGSRSPVQTESLNGGGSQQQQQHNPREPSIEATSIALIAQATEIAKHAQERNKSLEVLVQELGEQQRQANMRLQEATCRLDRAIIESDMWKERAVRVQRESDDDDSNILKNRLNAVEKKAAADRKIIVELKRDLLSEQAAKEEAMGRVSGLEAALRTEREGRDKSLNDLIHQNQTLKADNSKLAMENSKLAMESSRLASETGKLAMDNSRLATEASHLTTENSKLAKDKAMLAAENSRLLAELEMAQRAVTTDHHHGEPPKVPSTLPASSSSLMTYLDDSKLARELEQVRIKAHLAPSPATTFSPPSDPKPAADKEPPKMPSSLPAASSPLMTYMKGAEPKIPPPLNLKTNPSPAPPSIIPVTTSASPAALRARSVTSTAASTPSRTPTVVVKKVTASASPVVVTAVRAPATVAAPSSPAAAAAPTGFDPSKKKSGSALNLDRSGAFSSSTSSSPSLTSSPSPYAERRASPVASGASSQASLVSASTKAQAFAVSLKSTGRDLTK